MCKLHAKHSSAHKESEVDLEELLAEDMYKKDHAKKRKSMTEWLYIARV